MWSTLKRRGGGHSTFGHSTFGHSTFGHSTFIHLSWTSLHMLQYSTLWCSLPLHWLETSLRGRSPGQSSSKRDYFRLCQRKWRGGCVTTTNPTPRNAQRHPDIT